MKWGLNMELIGKKSIDMFSLHVYIQVISTNWLKS